MTRIDRLWYTVTGLFVDGNSIDKIQGIKSTTIGDVTYFQVEADGYKMRIDKDIGNFALVAIMNSSDNTLGQEERTRERNRILTDVLAPLRAIEIDPEIAYKKMKHIPGYNPLL